MMKCGLININGLSGKDHAVITTLATGEVDLMFLTETQLPVNRVLGINPTWIVSHHSSTRAVQAAGGRNTTDGVMIIARTKELADSIRLLHEEKGLSIIRLESTTIACVYSAPSDNDNKILELVTQAQEIADDTELLVIGDFNARLGNFSGDHQLNRRGRILLQHLQESNLLYLRPETGLYTSFNGLGRGIPDLVLTNNPDSLSELTVHESNSLGGSDHRLITFVLHTPQSINEQRVIERPDIRKLMRQHKQRDLQHILSHELDPDNFDWSSFTVNEAWLELKEKLNGCLKQTVGILKFQSRYDRFYTPELLNLQTKVIQQNDNLRILLNSRVQAPLIRAAQSRLTELNREYRTAIALRTQSLFDSFSAEISKSQNTASLMKVISCRQKRKRRKKAGLDSTKLDQYIGHYESTFGGEPQGDREEVELQLNDHADKYQWMEIDVFAELHQSALGKATGIDGVFGEVLKYGAAEIAPIMTKLFNKIEIDEQIPQDWKQALICPVYKKGDITRISNYRPIALTSTCRRVYERLLKQKLEEHVHKLQDSQGGFRAKRSTLMQVFAIHEIIVQNPGLHMVNLDFKAAYDMVNRKKLWRMLKERFKVDDVLLKRLMMLFDQNESCLVYNSKRSRFIPNKRGLLQGSSLSPLLFNFFIDEMLMLLKQSNHKVCTYGYRTNHLAFADDVNIHADAIPAVIELLQIVESWSRRVGMLFAPEKCIYINAEANHELKLYGQRIAFEESSLYLGIAISKTGIDSRKSVTVRLEKARKIISLLSEGGMNLGGFAPSASINLVKTFVRPVYEFGMQLCIWPQKELEQIQITQNMALRCILSAAQKTSISSMHKLLHVPLVKDRNQILSARFHAQLNNNQNATIPAVNLWWKGSNTMNRQSLIYNAKRKNKIWGKMKLKRHGFDRFHLVRHQRPISEPFGKAERKKLEHEMIAALDFSKTNVGGVIEMDDKPKFRACLKPGVVTKKKRIAIVKWLTGGVARHNPCRCGQEMSRVHAIECSGAGELILARFGSEIDHASGVNWISQVLNTYRNSKAAWVYDSVYDAIRMIYQNCLGYQQQANGFFAENQGQAERDANEALHGFNRPNRVQLIPARRNRADGSDRRIRRRIGEWRPP